MSFEGARIFEAEVLYSNPATHTARVRIARSTEVEPFECCVLMPHGDGTGKSHSISMPKVGAIVIVLVDSKDNAVILGCLPKASLGTEPSSQARELDGLSPRLRDTNYRGEDNPDVFPGDFSIKSNRSRLHLSDDELTIRSGNSRVEMSDIFGHAHMHSTADSVTHKNSLFTYKLLNPGGDANPELNIHAFTQNPQLQSSLEHVNNPEVGADLSITMNSATPIDINYDGSTAAITIDSGGNLLLKGNSVKIDAGGFVQQWGGDEQLNKEYNTAISLGSTKTTTLFAGGKLTLDGGTTLVTSHNATTIESGGTLAVVAGGSSKGLPLPGIDQSMSISAPSGAIEIKAGSYFPGPSSLTKPGIRIQSDGGGDIHIDSRPSPGGAMTTGAIVLDSAVPVSTSLSGGPGGYGIVLNSPLVLSGGLPGVADTPAGIPAPFPPPVPPVYDGAVKHFPHMTVYNTALVAGIVAGLTAAFPTTAAVSVPSFSAILTPALVAMSTLPVGRSISNHQL